MTSSILITGGAGYIGSHTAVELMNAGHHVVIVDNLCNSSIHVLDRLRALPADTLTLPSHGKPFTGLHQRIDQLHAHHRDRLAELGHAHSVEAWQGDALVGGLYGVSLGGIQPK